MKLKTVTKAANSQISGGSEYGWNCFGPTARWMDFCDISGTEIGSCVYDTLTQRVFVVEAYCDELGTHYSWYSKSAKTEYEKEAAQRKVDPYVAYDDKQTALVSKSSILAILESYSCRGGEVDGLSPDKAWPFPPTEKSADWDNASVTTDLVDDIDTFLNNLSDEEVPEEIERAFPNMKKKQSYTVTLNVKNRFTIDANSMEEAAEIATKLVENNMKLHDWGTGVCWEDKWVSKKTVNVK